MSEARFPLAGEARFPLAGKRDKKKKRGARLGRTPKGWEGSMSLLIFLGLVALVAFWLVGTYNTLVT
jgi:hypothetical protein